MTPCHLPETLSPLRPHPNRRQKRALIWTRIRIAGATLILGIALSAIYSGLSQQQLGLPANAIDCSYRAQILRERLVSLLNIPTRSVHAAGQTQSTEAFNNFSHLLRETRANCANTTSDLAQKIERIEAIFIEAQVRRQQDIAAREELRDL